jgi:hypothetical protein
VVAAGVSKAGRTRELEMEGVDPNEWARPGVEAASSEKAASKRESGALVGEGVYGEGVGAKEKASKSTSDERAVRL